MTARFFITVGKKTGITGESVIIFADKVTTEYSGKETRTQIAKSLRKFYAEHPTGFVRGVKFSPSKLFWAIYDNLDDRFPVEYSENCPRVIKGQVLEYEYRNKSSDRIPEESLWCITGHDSYNNCSGVLEWCYGQYDAQLLFDRMKSYKQFSQLNVEKFLEE